MYQFVFRQGGDSCEKPEGVQISPYSNSVDAVPEVSDDAFENRVSMENVEKGDASENNVSMENVEKGDASENNVSMENVENDLLGVELATLKDEVSRLKAVIQSKDDEIAVLKVEVKDKSEEAAKECSSLKRQVLIRDAEIDTLRKDLQSSKKGFSVSDIADSPADVSHYTGLPNIEVFNLILDLFEGKELNYYSGWKVSILSKADQLFLTLFKLRRNPSSKDIARRFCVSVGTAENVFLTWLSALHQVLFVELMGEIPSRFKNAPSNPEVFENFPNCRIVLDCTEIFAANPKKMSDQNDRFSNYKHRITYKALVGIAPNGTVTYLSSLYPGAASDKFIVQNCEILGKLEAGDSILADKGFLIGNILPPGVTLNIPPFKSTPKFTPQQIEETLTIAQPRVHVERAIRVIKTFQILDFIPGKCLQFATKIFQVCGALSNFKKPLIREVGDHMKSSLPGIVSHSRVFQ